MYKAGQHFFGTENFCQPCHSLPSQSSALQLPRMWGSASGKACFKRNPCCRLHGVCCACNLSYRTFNFRKSEAAEPAASAADRSDCDSSGVILRPQLDDILFPLLWQVLRYGCACGGGGRRRRQSSTPPTAPCTLARAMPSRYCCFGLPNASCWQVLSQFVRFVRFVRFSLFAAASCRMHFRHAACSITALSSGSIGACAMHHGSPRLPPAHKPDALVPAGPGAFAAG